MIYPWYEDIDNQEFLQQGDIIANCKVIVPGAEYYKAIISNIQSEEEAEIIEINAIVLSQSCDISHDKTDSIIVCPIMSLSEFVKSNTYYKNIKTIDELRQGKTPAFHLLNKLQNQELPEDYYIVNFRHIYSVPKTFLYEMIQGKTRKRLLPPYREHLSQAFARYFMRVGLPTDISRDDLGRYLNVR